MISIICNSLRPSDSLDSNLAAIYSVNKQLHALQSAHSKKRGTLRHMDKYLCPCAVPLKLPAMYREGVGPLIAKHHVCRVLERKAKSLNPLRRQCERF